jgi:antitoxin MazE
MKVSKWGNSLAVRLPASLVESLKLKEGDEIGVRPAAEGELEFYRKPSRQELLDRLDEFRGRLPADLKFDRDEANAR